MKTEYGVDWLLDCEPRIVQLETLARSYTSVVYRRHKEDDMPQVPFAIREPMQGFAYFLEMRLGKTNTLLNEWLLFCRDHGLKKLLVLAPNKYKAAWRTEAARFGIVSEVHVFDSNKRKEAAEFIAKKGEILIVNYEALVSDANMVLLKAFVDDRTMVAADESVLIKNRQSFFFRNGLLLAKEGAVCRILTGKPVVQGSHDLWSQLRFIRCLDSWNFFQFRNTFCKMGGFKGKQVIGVRNVERLQTILASCSFVASRADWGTSFDTDYETRAIKMLPAQTKAYKNMEEEFVTWLDSGGAVTADQVVTKHIKLQQISSGFIIDELGKPHDLLPDMAKLPKLLELKDSLENEVSGKALVICYYNHSLDVLEQHLKDYQPAIVRGAQAMKKAGREIEQEKWRFNSDPNCRVLLGQVQALKYGHMLMGSASEPCLTTFYYENTYSLDDRAQSEQRNQGEGQQASIHVVDFCDSEVERRIIAALQRKEDVAASILNYYKR
jgi:SNF2 family DNA or RNA helicase